MRLIARLTALAAALILAVSCLGDPTGPSTRAGGLTLQPRFANATAAAIVDIHAVRAVLRRPGQPRIVVDTVVLFPAAKDTLSLGIEVPLVATTEQMELTLAMTNTVGDTVFRAGPILVTASTNPSGQTPAEPVFTYVGTGSDASGVRFVEPPPAVLYGQSVTFAAEAFDAGELAIEGTPVGFELVNEADSVFANFVPAGSATLVAGTQRASVQVRALLPGGQSAIHEIAVQPAATIIEELPGGDMQSGTVGMPLEFPLEARLYGDDELPVQGEVVELTLTNSIEEVVLTQRDTSDATGLVSFTFTLPTTRGGYTAVARVVSNPDLAVGYMVEGLPAAGTALEMRVQPGTSIAGQPLSPSLEVHVLDEFGNTDEAATEPVTVALGDNPLGLGVLSGTVSVVPVNGVAVFDDLSVQRSVPGYTIVATSGALIPDTTATFEIVDGPPVGLGFFVQPPLAVPMETPFTVIVGAIDAFGNPTEDWSGSVTLSLGANPGQGTLSGTLTRTSVNGTVTFDDLRVDSVASGYSLDASASIGTGASNPFDVNPPASVNAWINVNGGNWSTAANWSRGTVPTSSDTVWVKAEGTYTVNLDGPVQVSRLEMGAETGIQTLRVPVGGSLTVADSALLTASVALEQLGGRIGGPGYLGVAGSYVWNGGDIDGAGLTRVLAGGTLAIQGTGAVEFTERTIELLGTGVWSGTEQVSSGDGATLRVAPGAALHIQGNPIWQHSLGGAASVFAIDGVVTQSAVASTVFPRLELEGTLNLNVGFLTAIDGVSNNGTLNVAAGTRLSLSGAHSFGAASTVQGAGDVGIVGSALVTSAGTWAITDTTQVFGTFVYNGAEGSVGTLDITNLGTRSGTGLLTVGSEMVWAGGTLSGTGTTRVLAGASLAMSGLNQRTLNGHTLELLGTTTWDGDAPLHAGFGAQIVNSGVFNWIGDGSIVADIGGATPVLENRGSFSRAGSAQVSLGAVMVDTVGSDWRLEPGGGLRFLNGARMGGTPFLGATLELVSGTLSMEDGIDWSVDGGMLRTTGGIVTVDSGGAATIPFFELWGGTLSHEGIVEITGNLDWTAGRIESNTAGLGGRTRIMPNVALGTSGAAVKEFFGTHVIEVTYDGPSESGGHFVFDGTGNLSAGGGARIENHARVWMQGSGAMLSDLGAPTAVFENTALGSIEATTGTLTGTRVMGFALDNLGTVFVDTDDALHFTGGSVNRFGGNWSRAVGRVGQIALGGANVFAVTDAFTVQAPLAITGTAMLDLGAVNSTVNGDLILSGEGRIRSASALAVLHVDGNAVFGGGADEMSAGVLEIDGDFSQSLVGATSFQATGTHVTRFTGLGAQSITFANPGAVTNHFANLEISNMSPTDSVAIGSNVYVADSLYVLTGRLGGVSPHRLVVAGNLNLVSSNFVRPFVLDLAGEFTNDEAGVAPDTLVLNRANTYSWDDPTPGATHVRFNDGMVIFDIQDPSPGDVIVSGTARLVVPATGSHPVFGNFATQDNGTLEMSIGSDLSVEGDATFAGGSTAGQLIGGQLSVTGDFTQLSTTSVSSFAPSAGHTTRLNGTGAQQISIADPANSRFGRLWIASTGNRVLTMQSSVTVVDSLTMAGGSSPTELRSATDAERLVVGGRLTVMQQTGYNRLAPAVLQLSMAPTLDIPFAPVSGVWADTVVYVGSTLTALPMAPALQYASIRVATDNVLPLLNSGGDFPDTLSGDLDIESGGVDVQEPGTGELVILGKLRTRGTGVLQMQTPDQHVTVLDSAIFAGGSTAGRLTAGSIDFRGAFQQDGGVSSSSYQASDGHFTVFNGLAPQTIAMSNPGETATDSRFATMFVGNTLGRARIELLSDVRADVLADSSEGWADTIRTVPAVSAVLSAGRVSLSNTVFNGTPLILTDSMGFVTVDTVRFENMDPTATYLTFTRDDGQGVTFNGVDFAGPVPTTGYYFQFIKLNTIQSAAVNFNTSTPASLGGRYLITGNNLGLAVQWNGAPLP